MRMFRCPDRALDDPRVPAAPDPAAHQVDFVPIADEAVDQVSRPPFTSTFPVEV
jgi:hypothetical protein